MSVSDPLVGLKTSLLEKHSQASGFLIAVSGGLDSVCLLHFLVELSKNTSCPPIRALHINHGLHKNADRWARHVEALCADFDIPFISAKVVVSEDEKRRLGTEAAARECRYQVFEQYLNSNEILMLAQHGDDQVETLLLRMLRGAGVAGLQAMPLQRKLGLGWLYRPFLEISKRHLKKYAKDNELVWCEDPSNQDVQFDRNYLRHKIIPSLYKRWPSLPGQVSSMTKVMQETQSLLEELGASDLQQILTPNASGLQVSIKALRSLSRSRQNNVLRYWFSQNSVPMPSYMSLNHIHADFLQSAVDAQPQLAMGGWSLRRNGQCLVLIKDSQESHEPIAFFSLLIDAESLLSGHIKLPHGALIAAYDHGLGIALKEGDVLEQRARKGGERCKPIGRAHSQSLKKLLQEAKVPAWERANVPLFFVNGELAMVGNLWVNSGFSPSTNQPIWSFSQDC